MADPFPTLQGHLAHGSWSMNPQILTVANGIIEFGPCSECHLIVAACAHEFSTWNEDGTQLTCNLCGIDGT